MEDRVKERLTGAAVLISLAVIFMPMLMEPIGPTEQRPTAVPAPPREFSSRTVPLEEPRMTKLDEVRAHREARLVPESTTPMPGWNEGHATTSETTQPTGTAEMDEATVTGNEPLVERGAWVVQLASFSEVQNAAALRDRLRASGYTAFTESVYGERGSVTRVYVGPELEREEARLTVDALERDTNLRGIVVRYPPS